MSRDRDSLLRNLQTRMTKAGFSDRALSTAIGRNPGWLNGLLNRGAVPNALDLRKIAHELGCSMDELFSAPSIELTRSPGQILTNQLCHFRNAHGFDRPEVTDVISWFVCCEGRLEQDEWIADFYELFEAPDMEKNLPCPTYVGPQSLTALAIRLMSVSELVWFFETSSQALRSSIVTSHQAVLNSNKPDLKNHTLEFEIPDSLYIKVDYMRVLLPVRRSSGRPLVLNYAKPTKRTERLSAEAIQGNPDAAIRFL